jgi:hypothetical protein
MRYLLLLLVVLSSCEVKVSTGHEETKEKKAGNKNKIRNGIDIKSSGGVNIEQAFLTYVEDGSFVSEDNSTGINKPVKLNLIVKGWKEKEGKVYLDAEQKVTTSEGNLILDKKNMLAEFTDISPKDAEYLSFQVVITRLNKIFDYFLVEVKAWNKEFDQTVEASFKIHIE